MGTSSSMASSSVRLDGKGFFVLSSSFVLFLSISLYLALETEGIRVDVAETLTNSLNKLRGDPGERLTRLSNRVGYEQGFPIVGDESIMSSKAHGSCPSAVQTDLRWNCDRKVADNICCFNRHYAGNVRDRFDDN